MPVLLSRGVNRKRVMEQLGKERVQTGIHCPSVHHFTYYRESFPNMNLPDTENFAAKELTIPRHALLGEPDIEYSVAAFARAISKP